MKCEDSRGISTYKNMTIFDVLNASNKSTYSSFLIHISSIGQKVHHAVKVALPGCPDQRSGPILHRNKRNYFVIH